MEILWNLSAWLAGFGSFALIVALIFGACRSVNSGCVLVDKSGDTPEFREAVSRTYNDFAVKGSSNYQEAFKIQSLHWGLDFKQRTPFLSSDVVITIFISLFCITTPVGLILLTKFIEGLDESRAERKRTKRKKAESEAYLFDPNFDPLNK